MAGHYIRDEVRLGPPARRVAGFALLLLPVSLLFYRLGAVSWDAFLLLLALIMVLALLAGLVALGGIAKAWSVGARGGGVALAALLVALVALSPFALAGLLALENPLVAEAVTDEYDPLAAVPAAGAAPVVALTSGRRYEAAAPQVYAAMRQVLGDNGWTVEDVVAGDPNAAASLANPDDLGRTTGEIPIPTPRSGVDMAIAADPLERPDADQYRVAAETSDLLFARVSDIAIRIVEENGTTRVDMRSASREGGFDFGQNRRFIDDFLAALDEAMTGAEAAIPSA